MIGFALTVAPALLVPSAPQCSSPPVPPVALPRRSALAAAAAAAAGRAPARAFAADKGKEYNDCMSKCMYEVPV